MPLESEPAKANPAKRELAQIASTASASPAAIVNARSEHVEIQPRSLGPFHCLLIRLALLVLDPAFRISQGSLELVRFIR